MKTRKWCQTTWLAKMFRKICILTYLGHDLTLTWPDLRSVFEIDLPRSKDTFFESSPRAEHDGVIFIFVFYKKIAKNHLRGFFFDDLWEHGVDAYQTRHTIFFSAALSAASVMTLARDTVLSLGQVSTK